MLTVPPAVKSLMETLSSCHAGGTVNACFHITVTAATLPVVPKFPSQACDPMQLCGLNKIQDGCCQQKISVALPAVSTHGLHETKTKTKIKSQTQAQVLGASNFPSAMGTRPFSYPLQRAKAQ